MSLTGDLRLAARSLAREPGFAAGVVVTFALAIGSVAAMLGLVQRLMLSPPPGIRDAGRVVRLGLTFQSGDGDAYTVTSTSYPVFRALAELPGVFRDVAAVRSGSLTVGRGGELSEVSAVQASGAFFQTLGVRPHLGRLFGLADDGLPLGRDVVVLGHAYWRRTFGGDPAVVGGELTVDGRPFEVIGVVPRGFHGTELGATDIFVPLSAALRAEAGGWWSDPGLRVGSVVARLADSVTASAAAARVASALGDESLGLLSSGLVATPLESLVPGQSGRSGGRSAQGRIALWLSGVALLVLAVATANAGTLLLLRAARRWRDGAVRLALGASLARLLRQSLLESAMLALAGAGLGLVLSRWLGDLVRTVLLPDLAPTESVVDGKVLLASIVAACAAGLLAGLAPLAQLRRRDLSLDLRAGGQTASARFGVQRLLVALQVALCLVLLFGAGLFVRSLHRVRSQDLGFSTARLLHLELDFRGSLQGRARDEAHQDAVRRILTVPGVAAATVVQGMPFSSHHIPPIHVPGYTFPPGTTRQLPILYGATPEYLRMMGVVLRQGRLFTEADGRGAPPVVLVNETMARTIWPGDSALGKCVRAGHAPGSLDGDPMAAASTLPCREVVGVVRDSRARSLRLEGGEDRLMQYYVPFGQLPLPPRAEASSAHAILVEAASDPVALAGAVQRIVQATSAVPVYARVRPYQELLDPQLRSWRLGATLFSAFGVLALAIAALGLFAVVSYLVTQRRREIGVRVALGATGAAVAGLVVKDALRMAGAGAFAGALLAWGAAPLAGSLLFQTSPRDPVSLLASCAALLAVTAGAAAAPAFRATRVLPASVLRADG